MFRSITLALVAATLFAPLSVQAKAVYAHYLVGTTDPDHAATDVQDALSVGFDGFAMNVGDPTAQYAINCVQELFAAANGTDFKLFFSMDMGGNSDVTRFDDFFTTYLGSPNYLKVGSNNKPLVSTFDGGNTDMSQWQTLKTTYNLYLMPDFDDYPNYYSDPSAFFSAWGGIIDGAFDWESAWPAPGNTPENVTTANDMAVMQAATAAGKDFMIGLSSLQYKHCCGGDYYRIGEVNLPQRMGEILDLAPNNVEVITWNDAGESHYIGNIWPEGLNADELAYANMTTFPHNAWQPLVTSFITAFRNGGSASTMSPPSGSSGAIGAMWYRPVLKSCTSDSPMNAASALDAVNYAVVMPAGQSGTVKVTSNGQVLAQNAVGPGLNYAAVEGMQLGAQSVELLDASGNVLMTANSQHDVQTDFDGFCNFNYCVVGLAQ